MSKANYDLEEMIRRVAVDAGPDPAHRTKLRWQMLSAFNKTACKRASRQTTRRTIMKSPITKLIAALAAAAVLVIVITAGVYRPEPDIPAGELLDRPYPTSTPDNNTDSELEPIHIDLPMEVQVGTLEDHRVPNLEKPLGKPRPPFLAPVGTKNVALGKPVSSSDEQPIIGETEMITDGDKETADGSYVELGPFAQHVTIDLEAIHSIYAVIIWHYHKQPRAYFDVVVQVADDPDFITNVRTIFNNDIDNSLGLGVGEDMHYGETYEGKLVDAKGIKARYVRLHSRGNTSNDLNHYIEVEVYGIPPGAKPAK